MSDLKETITSWVEGKPIAPKDFAPREFGSTFSDLATVIAEFLGVNKADKKAQGEEIYTDPKNLPTAIASIMNKAQNRADFHPARQDAAKLSERYNDYIVEVDKTPFFHLERNDHTKNDFKSKNYDKLIDQIVELYEGIKDKSKLKDGLKNMAKRVFSSETSEEWKNLFSQSSIDFENPHSPKLFIYYTVLHMKHQKDGKSEINEQSYEVNQAVYSVLPQLIHDHAKTLAKLDVQDIEDWIEESTSPKNPSIGKTCV
ncbi:MAG: hypothetical protein MI784_05910 [Cytophagales bacterium]|nr:hypothetical protein [Cytophagales bacterium]